MKLSIDHIQNEFWDNKSKSIDFKDPFYLAQLQPFISMNSSIVEYGCGYGRILNLLHENGYCNTSGFDFSQQMIKRGKSQYPQLNLQHIEHATIPLPNESADAVILSTVLCCVPDNQAQENIIKEIHRILKPNSPLYLTDFLITNSQSMIQKYQDHFPVYNEWGIYLTSEGALVRHHSQAHIEKLLNDFTNHWYHEEDFVTMNNNAVRAFHGIYLKTNI